MAEPSKDRVKFWRPRQLPQVELLHASYVKQSFSRHFHEGFALGAVEQGALRFSYRGERLTASPGCVNLVIPGEAHDGEAAGEDGWTYRMFYLDNSLMERAVFELSGKEKRLPFIAAGVLEATVAAMKTPPRDIVAWLGPAAGRDAYEIGEDVFDAFAASDPRARAAFVATRPGHWNVDLYALAKQRLADVGVADVHGGGLCTMSDPARFYSHRRDQRTGRMATLVWRE